MRTRFSIKQPKNARKSFALVKNVRYRDGRVIQTTLEDEAIEALNRNFHSGVLTHQEALVQIKAVIIPSIKKREGIADRVLLESSISEQNAKVFEKFWAETYKHAHLINPTSTKNDILRAIKAIDPLSLVAATKEALQEKLDKLPAKQQRRATIRINKLLSYIGRGFILVRKKPVYSDVHFVTWDELQKILPHIHSEEVRNLAVTLWSTGVRLGEAFAPSFTHLKPNDSIYIKMQMDLEGNIRGIKNGKPHHTVLLKEGREAYKAWCAVEDKKRWRNAAINQIINAAKKAFPGKKEKQVSAHDLRHSYAIKWLELGASLTQVAGLLGDTVATVQMHYTGFDMSSEAIESLRALVK